ncbi:calcium/calmodulin-dependent protein kinase [Byssothecium circinans]|uniref:mitogen-activated protein kinase n=1 Tax=Byssothecium circinans TaxID=147558 RepID=A0A6A5UBI0_9PLEO|nr:calcium/calmodulin-dependent protein kinase [Byssothecium circinans]
MPSPHPLALFSLIPLNDRANAVLDHPNNRHLVSFIPGAENESNPEVLPRGLNIGLHIASKSSRTLATIGRIGDITVEGSSISRIQCSFEIYEHTEEICLFDRSTSYSTQTFGPNALPFQLDRPARRVVIAPTVNDHFGFGGVACDLVQFQIYWHECVLDLKKQISYREDHPCFTRTVDDETPTALPSKRATRIHTPAVHNTAAQGLAKQIRFYKKTMLGEGSFGEVWRAVDVDSGDLFALKLVKWPDHGLHSHEYTMLKREVETLAAMSHPNIVEFISAQSLGVKHLAIFTQLKEGNIEDIIKKDVFIRDRDSATSLLRHMLQALDYLAFNGIVHRDVKPANILYTSLPAGGYTFQLADFGLCNFIVDARTFAGSPIFMAPELLYNPGSPQTSKVDVWSLFVTLAYAMNVAGFREKPLRTNELKIRAAHDAANDASFHSIQDMAFVDPERRASAAEMLDKIFNGEGRSTPRNQISKKVSGVDDNALAPRKEQKLKITKVVQKRHGQGLEVPVTTGKHRDGILDAVGGVRSRSYF